MVLIVGFSHLKGALLGIKLSANDFSDYLKFLMPPMIALGAYKVCDNGGGNALISLFRAVSLVYAIFFLGYIFWGAGFVYSIGLGRGAPQYYRYGGLDHNPNAYAAIAVSLMFFLFFTAKKREVKHLVLTALIALSVILSQSRTSLIALVLVIAFGFLLIRVSISKKIVFILSICFLIFFSVSSLDLYWLTYPGRFDIVSDNSFSARVENSFTALSSHAKDVGLIGIGPAKEELDRLDTISYILYFLRYGILGIIIFIGCHLWFSIYFFLKYIANRKKLIFYRYNQIFFMNMLFPLYVLIVNISNEKWIDFKFLTVWFVMLGMGVYAVMRIKREIT
jgi:hypothetical protein